MGKTSMFGDGKRGVGRLVAAVLGLGGNGHAPSTPLDKLVGKDLTVGDLLFSNIQAPSFVGVGPGAIDVQGVIVADPVSGLQRTGLRFVAPLAQSRRAGPHEIVMNIVYTLTDLAGRLATAHQSLNATASGEANVYFFTQASPSAAFVADDHLTVLESCAIAPVPGFACSPSSAALFPGYATYFVEHQVQMIVSTRNGTSGVTSLQEFGVLYG